LKRKRGRGNWGVGGTKQGKSIALLRRKAIAAERGPMRAGRKGREREESKTVCQRGPVEILGGPQRREHDILGPRANGNKKRTGRTQRWRR